MAAELGISDRVHFAGTVTEIESLRPYYEGAFLSVSPGFVGLSLIQSLAFGVPMLIADSEPHAPEIEAADANNSMRFRARNARSLSEGVVHLFNRRSHWAGQRQRIAAECQAKYTYDAMVDAFKEAIDRAMNQSRGRLGDATPYLFTTPSLPKETLSGVEALHIREENSLAAEPPSNSLASGEPGIAE